MYIEFNKSNTEFSCHHNMNYKSIKNKSDEEI